MPTCGDEAEPVRRDVAASQHEHADAEDHGERPDDRGERHHDRQQQRVRPGGAPAAALPRLAVHAQPVGGDARAGGQREQDEKDGRAETAGGQGSGRGGQEGVRDARPGPQEPGGEQRAGGEVGGEPGQRDRADQQHADGEARRAEEQGRQGGEQGEVGRGGLGAAGADGVPGVRILPPERADLGRGGQQGAARQCAAAEEIAAGDEGDDEEQREEDGSGLAADALEAGELVDFEEVGVVAAGSGFDGSVARAARVGVAAAEVARDLVDGGPHGRAGRREQRAQFGGIDDALAPVAAGGEDAAGAQQGAEKAGDLVEGLAGHLADEVGEGTEQGADDEPEQNPGQGLAPCVDEHRVDRARLVDAVRAGDRAAGAVDGAAFAGGGLGVPQHGVRGDEDAVARQVGAPAQVHVVAHQGSLRSKPPSSS